MSAKFVPVVCAATGVIPMIAGATLATGACVAASAYGILAASASYVVVSKVCKASQLSNPDPLDGWEVVPTPTVIADDWELVGPVQ